MEIVRAHHNCVVENAKNKKLTFTKKFRENNFSKNITFTKFLLKCSRLSSTDTEYAQSFLKCLKKR